MVSALQLTQSLPHALRLLSIAGARHALLGRQLDRARSLLCLLAFLLVTLGCGLALCQLCSFRLALGSRTIGRSGAAYSRLPRRLFGCALGVALLTPRRLLLIAPPRLLALLLRRLIAAVGRCVAVGRGRHLLRLLLGRTLWLPLLLLLHASRGGGRRHLAVEKHCRQVSHAAVQDVAGQGLTDAHKGRLRMGRRVRRGQGRAAAVSAAAGGGRGRRRWRRVPGCMKRRRRQAMHSGMLHVASGALQPRTAHPPRVCRAA